MEREHATVCITFGDCDGDCGSDDIDGECRLRREFLRVVLVECCNRDARQSTHAGSMIVKVYGDDDAKLVVSRIAAAAVGLNPGWWRVTFNAKPLSQYDWWQREGMIQERGSAA